MTNLAVEWVDVPDPEPNPPTFLIELIQAAVDGEITDEGQFPLRSFLLGIDPEKLLIREDRIELTKTHPLTFALVYLSHHLRSKTTGDKITFASLHAALMESATDWQYGTGNLREHRDCYVAPRDSGKTTWLFLILPMWVAAHEFFRFIAAYSDAVEQARTHLGTFRDELETNELLQWDYPLLCTPKVFGTTKRAVSQRSDKIEQANGFKMVAKGMNAASLGLKIGKDRPELIILDDIEPGEEKYSLEMKERRLEALRSKIFYQNQSARVVLIGTVTMPGSIIHELVQSKLFPSEDTPEWISDENMTVHYFPPILDDDAGNQSSCWPEKWPLEYLLKHQHEREYKKNFLNQPVSEGGDYWGSEDIQYLTSDMELLPVQTILQIDPAVKSHRRSHYTGMAVISYDPAAGLQDLALTLEGLKKATVGKCILRHVRRVKLPPKKFRELVLKILDTYPEIGRIRIESNQGGDTWNAVLHDMPVPVKLHDESIAKEIRTVNMLTHYQRGRVIHEQVFTQFEGLLFAYPNVMEDDQIDAVSAGIEFFLKPPAKKKKMEMRRVSYV